jgi:hypothetical protein
MAYGSDGSNQPQEPPRRRSRRRPAPHPQPRAEAGNETGPGLAPGPGDDPALHTGPAPRHAGSRPAPRRPQPYDPYQIRARDRLAEQYREVSYGAGRWDRGPDLRAPSSVLDGTADQYRDEFGAPTAPAPAPRGPVNRRRGRKSVSPQVRRRRRMIRRGLLGAFLIVLGYVGVTMYPYLTGPGTDPMAGRAAEWARDHGLGSVVTWLENTVYTPPPTGGRLSAGQLAQLQGPTQDPTGKAAVRGGLPPDIAPLALPGLPGEGVWHPLTTDAAGEPIVEKAALRPDAQHTSALAYVVWMSQKALRFTLHPGYQEPGGTWSEPDSIPAGQRTGLVAAWNGGFKVVPDDALGGYYADGRAAVPLVDGKAAEVFYRDGSVKVGQWGRDETMGPAVIGVRQNLSLLVDGGRVMADSHDGSSKEWGYTINNSYFIARSGIGMTANGDMVYISGSELSVFTLAQLLKAAGAVYGMELDINPDWITFMSFGGTDPANPAPTKLWDFTQPADRYFQPSTRDFVTVYTR